MSNANARRWHRIAPGQYELLSSEGTRIAIVERSRLMPWIWWYEAWSERVSAVGNRSSMTRAKEAVVDAFDNPGGTTQ